MCYRGHLQGRLLLLGDGPQEGKRGQKVVGRGLAWLDYNDDGEEGGTRTERESVGFSDTLNADITKEGYQR